jgi:hypothetical protein
MLEYCLGPGWDDLAVGSVHYLTRIIFWTIDSSM